MFWEGKNALWSSAIRLNNSKPWAADMLGQKQTKKKTLALVTSMLHNSIWYCNDGHTKLIDGLSIKSSHNTSSFSTFRFMFFQSISLLPNLVLVVVLNSSRRKRNLVPTKMGPIYLWSLIWTCIAQRFYKIILRFSMEINRTINRIRIK